MNNINCQKPCHFFFQNENEIFTANKPNTIKKSKYQEYFHCFIVCTLVPYAFWFSLIILINVTRRGAALIKRGGDYFSVDAKMCGAY